MKKSLIFWLAAVTCAAWILVGCESPTNGEKGAAGANAPGTLPSGATPAMLAALFETTDTVIVGLPLGEGTFTVPAGKTLAVAGTVDITSENTVINAFDGTLDVSAGGFTADGGNVFIVAEAAAAAVKAAAPGGIVPAYVASIPASPTQITEDVVLPSLSIGGSGTSAADFGTFAGTSKTVYVKGNLTIDATTPFNTGSAKITVLGNTTAKGAGGVTFGATTVIGTLKATNALTITAVGAGKVKKLDLNGYAVTITDATNIGEITSSATGGSLALAATPTIAKLAVGASDITVTSTTTTSLTVSTFSTDGTGKLILPKETVTFTATAGGGKIAYAAAPASVTLSSTTGLTYVGNLSVAGAVSVTGPLTVDGEADFGETVTLYSTASFGGDVTVTATKVLTLSANAVTLAATKSIKVGTDIVLTAGAADVVLTPDGASTLTPASKELTLGAQNLALTSGALTVATGSTLVLSKVLTVAAGAELAVAGDVTVTVSVGGLTLTGSAVTDGAKLTGAGKVTAVAASIVGGTGGWQAVGEGTTITLTATGANAVSITGTGATPKLVGGTGGVISTGSNSTYSALTVQLLEIDLTTAGSIVIPHNSTASTIVLKGGTATLGKLTLDSAQITTVGTSHYVKIHRNGDANGKAGVTTDKSGVVTGAGDNAGVKAGSIAGGTTVSDNDMTITGLQASYDVTLDNTALFADS